MEKIMARIHRLDLWTSKIDIEPLSGGITNRNFIVRDHRKTCFVRIGNDISEHGIMRFNEHAASRAAHLAGISPAVLHSGPGIMVLRYIEGETLCAQDICKPEILPRVVALIQRCHHDIPAQLRGPALTFWVFQVLRHYTHTLNQANSPWCDQFPRLTSIAAQLEQDVGDISLVFGHNDLLPANLLNDGERLWLIDWDYAGFNSPLFDLGGLASNCGMNAQQENDMLNNYFGAPPKPGLLKKYAAMKCASLLRESMWSMVSELHSLIEFDYPAYTRHNLRLFEQEWTLYLQTTTQQK